MTRTNAKSNTTNDKRSEFTLVTWNTFVRAYREATPDDVCIFASDLTADCVMYTIHSEALHMQTYGYQRRTKATTSFGRVLRWYPYDLNEIGFAGLLTLIKTNIASARFSTDGDLRFSIPREAGQSRNTSFEFPNTEIAVEASLDTLVHCTGLSKVQKAARNSILGV